MHYKLRKQIKNKGYQAGFELESIFVKEAIVALEVNFDIDKYAEQWKVATTKGISVFYNHYQKVFAGKLTITITTIDWFPVDTSEILISYFIIRVLCDIHRLDYLSLIGQSEFTSLYDFNQMSFVFNNESLSYYLE
jgi:hypothetical protein